MAIKSNNTQGNQYHDEKTGEFTSPDGGSAKSEQTQQPQETKKTDEPVLSEPAKTKINKFRLKANVEDIRHNLKTTRQVSSIPVLYSSRDVLDHLEEFFPEEVVRNIESKFGKFSVPYKYFNLRTDPNERCGVNIFAACIGKKRWTNNYMKLIDREEYNKMSNNYRFRPLYRGLQGTDEQFHTIANSYSSKENEMIYGSVGGTCYGIAVYASDRFGEARSYAGGYGNHVMNLMLDRNSVTMCYNQICRIRDELHNNRDTIKKRAEQIFLNYGIESTKAKQMAISFGDYTISDEGFVAMLMGIEWYQSGSYHMIQNLGRVYRLL